MSRNKLPYWEKRQIENIYRYMQLAEDVADQIAVLYLKASRYLSIQAEDIFEKYKTKHNLSEKEARELLNSLNESTSLEEMLQCLKNANNEEKKELVKKLEAPAYRARLERLKQLQNQIDLVMKDIYQQERGYNLSHYVDLAMESYYRSVFDIHQQTGVAFSFNHISAKQIDRVIHSRWSGKNYSSRIWKNTRTLAKVLKEELLINLVTGRTEREVADIIANKFGQGSVKARRLVRTESNYIATQMQLESFKECEIERYQFCAVLDLKTSKVCRKLDEKVFLVKQAKMGENCPPMHPWCRSTILSVIKEEYLERMTRSAKDPVTGKIITIPRTMGYEEWYDKYVKGNKKAEVEEKKIKNRATDRRQYKEYRNVLGDDIPETLDKFQDMKYNDFEKWKYTKLDYQRKNQLRKHPELKLPNAEKAVALDGKFEKYLFGGERPEGLAKGKAITSRLGYDITNWKDFRMEIISSASEYPVVFKESNGFKDMYEQKIVLNGLNEKPANLIVGWAVDKDTASMASVYIKEVK